MPGAPAEESKQITLYTSVPQNIIDNIQQDFEQKNPDVTLEVFRAGTGSTLAKLEAERESGVIHADVVWVADFSVYETFKEEGLLMAYDAPEAQMIPERFYDPDHYYYGARLINVVLAYNTSMIKGSDVPTSWFDLLRPEVKGRVGSSNPQRSGVFFVATGAFVDNPEMGWNFFERYAQQNPPVQDSNTGIAKKIASGELLAGIALDYTIRKMKQGGSPIDLVWPKEGVVLAPSPIGIIADTDSPETSKRFVSYVLSKEGQRELTANGFVPARRDVSRPEGVPPLEDIKYMDVDWPWLRSNREQLISRFNSMFGID
jgi:iron(III) transport system substrate-binding protein